MVQAGNPLDCDVRKKDDCSAQNHKPLFYPTKTVTVLVFVILWEQK
jgi:hypothetical protein